MNTVSLDKTMAQKAMDKMLVDFLFGGRQPFVALGISQITRMDGDTPCWYLWTEDNQGVYQVKLQDVGQVLCGGHGIARPRLEMEADFVCKFLPFAEAEVEAA